MNNYCAAFMERMDFDIGSLLYLVLTAFAVIAGIARKKKKRPVLAAPSDDEAEKNSKPGFLGMLQNQFDNLATEAKMTMDNLKGEVLMSDVENAIIETQDYFENIQEDNEIEIQEEDISKMPAFEGLYSPDDLQNAKLEESEGIKATEPMEIIELDENLSGFFDRSEIVDDFDLRKAVIYSVILNRLEV